MNPEDMLIKSAEALEAQAAQIVELETKLATEVAEKTKLAEHIAQAKTASEKNDAASEAAKADIAAKAKLAADAALRAGLLANEERRDQFAAKIQDPVQALEALAKVAEKVNTAPKVATVVPRIEAQGETADDVWARHVHSANTSTGSR